MSTSALVLPEYRLQRPSLAASPPRRAQLLTQKSVAGMATAIAQSAIGLQGQGYKCPPMS